MFFRPATHEPVFRKFGNLFGDLVSRNNGGSDDLTFGGLSYIGQVAVKTPLNICYRKIKFLLFFLFYKGDTWRWWSMRTWWLN